MNRTTPPSRVLLSLLLTLSSASVAWGGAGEPCLNDNSPVCAFVNEQWRAGNAAGNVDDWYRNRDSDHAHIDRGHFPQLQDYGTATSGYERYVVDAPRTIVGNASLGVGGQWGMVRYYGMNSWAASSHYNQYRANQHYWHPATGDVNRNDLSARDLSIAMFPYVSQSFGVSRSELDEVTKFFHTLAAFRPDTKNLLEEEGLLIPTLQMIFRRTRVADDAAYLSGLAHPSAFDNTNNDLRMVQMANGITADTIPPMVRINVLDEDFGGTHATRYNEGNKSEQQFTTPAAVARVHRGIEAAKRMVIDLGDSFDVHGLPLTYHTVVLRGDPESIHITPLDADGSRVEVVFDYPRTVEDAFTGRPSSLAVVGVFVHNGHYYSAPGFITSLGLWNEQRTYDSDGLLQRTVYTDTVIESGISGDRTWDSDTYTYDFNQRPAGWVRAAGSTRAEYCADGMRVLQRDAMGRPLVVTPMRYTTVGGDVSVAAQFDNTDWRYRVDMRYATELTPADIELTREVAPSTASSLSLERGPRHGSVTFWGPGRNDAGPVGYTYTPDPGFTGVDTFSFRETNDTDEFLDLRRVRVAVGPTDSEPPARVSGLVVSGVKSSEAMITWQPTTDDVEVARYDIYRDGALVGSSAIHTSFIDATVEPGVAYDYTMVAVDDHGNESVVSGTVSGGGAELWGQDDFEDNTFWSIDPALPNGLRWVVVEGKAGMHDRALKVGGYHPGRSLVISNRAVSPPFFMEFLDTQAYVAGHQGVLLLYQDANNYYQLVINKYTCQLYRVRDGAKTSIGQAAIGMQHYSSTARYEVQVTAAGGILAFQVTRRDWTVNPAGVVSAFWTDDDADAYAVFHQGGEVGFIQPDANEYNVAAYDDIMISRQAGEGVDLDGDGLVDAWERARFGSLDAVDGDPDADPDADGMSNLEEQGAGTNPHDAASVFVVKQGEPAAGAGWELRWPSVAGKTYAVLYCTDLDTGNWQAVPGLESVMATPPENAVILDRTLLPDPASLRLHVLTP